MHRGFFMALVLPSLLVCASNLFDESQAVVVPNGCMERIEIKNSYTPIDLFKSSAVCIEEQKYPQAVELYLVATAYGYFDTGRVVDKSTRNVLDAFKTEIFGPLDAKKRNQFAEALRTRLDDMKSSCSFLSKLGHPTYYPEYMVQTGVTRGDGLILNYNAKALWEDTRINYLRCP